MCLSVLDSITFQVINQVEININHHASSQLNHYNNGNFVNYQRPSRVKVQFRISINFVVLRDNL